MTKTTLLEPSFADVTRAIERSARSPGTDPITLAVLTASDRQSVG